VRAESTAYTPDPDWNNHPCAGIGDDPPPKRRRPYSPREKPPPSVKGSLETAWDVMQNKGVPENELNSSINLAKAILKTLEARVVDKQEMIATARRYQLRIEAEKKYDQLPAHEKPDLKDTGNPKEMKLKRENARKHRTRWVDNHVDANDPNSDAAMDQKIWDEMNAFDECNRREARKEDNGPCQGNF
jgi:hypothetical protein